MSLLCAAENDDMEQKYKLVIFDLDGTLIDTLEDLAEAVNHALRLRGLPLHSLEEYRKMVGHGVRNLVMQALPEQYRDGGGQKNGESEAGPEARQVAQPDMVEAALADFKAYYTAHIDVHSRPYPGMQQLVRDLHEAGVLMAVASNKFQAGTEHLVREFFPGIPFVAILGNREGRPLKPDPEIVGEVLRAAAPDRQAPKSGGTEEVREEVSTGATGLSREDAVMVGDSSTDMLTARSGCIAAIAVGWGYRPMAETEEYGYAGSVTQLRTMLSGRPFYVSEPMSSAPDNPRTALQKAIYQTFEEYGISYSRVDTDPGITMEDCRHISSRIGVPIVKTVFVCNRQQTEFYLYVMPDDKPFITKDFCSALGIPRVSFASEEKLRSLTGVAAGATTILSAILPEAAGVHLVIDRQVVENPVFACTDGTDTCFVWFPTQDLLGKYIPASGHNYTVI